MIADYAELARLGHVSRARVSQVLNLLNLASDIQEALLFLPRTERGRDDVLLADLQPLASAPDWRAQRRRWERLRRYADRGSCRWSLRYGRQPPPSTGPPLSSPRRPRTAASDARAVEPGAAGP
jgi:hypothetical protein